MKKVILIVYAVSAVLAGAVAVIFPQFVDVSIYSVFPFIGAAYMAVGSVFMYCFGEFNRHTLSRRVFGFDFKYSKRSGKGEFDVISERGVKAGFSVYVLIYAIISAAAVPFVIFFPYVVKIGFALVVLVISPLIQLSIEARAVSQKIKSDVESSEREKQELDEQKKREEMGKWK